MFRIKELRLEKGLNQKEFAEKINSTSKNIWAYENNVAVPPLDVLSRMADFFGCSIDFLTGRTDDFGNVTIKSEQSNELPPDSKELLNIFNALDPLHRVQVLEYARYFATRSGVKVPKKNA